MTEKIENEPCDNLEIVVKKDVERDIDLIGETFQLNASEALRNRVLYFYKPLGQKIQDQEDEQKVVEEYFRKIYADKDRKIDEIVARSEKVLKERSSPCLKVLTCLMDYKSEENQEFIATPTLLPYSPFRRPTFFFSIARELAKGDETEILDIAIHEISHFLFFDIVRDLGFRLQTNPETKGFEHLFKEALTGMLLSEPELETLLDRKGYLGNPEVHFLSVKIGAGETITLREYLRQVFRDYQSQGLSFSDFIRDTINRILPKAEEFSRKKIFWDQNEREPRSEGSKLLESYREPIEI